MPKGVYKRTKEPFNKRNDIRLKYEEIIKLYSKDLLSTKEISKKFNCSRMTIHNILIDNDAIMDSSERKKLLYSTGKIHVWSQGLNKNTSKSILSGSKNISKTKKRMFIEGTLKVPNNKGRKSSDITKQKLSKKRKGWKMPESGKEKLRKIKRWNVGLTKETSPLVAEISIKIRNNAKNNPNYGMKGKHHSSEQVKSQSERMKGKFLGEKNPAWIDGRSFLPYNKDFNKRFKEAIKIRDGFLCLKCGMRNDDAKILLKCGLHAHHIDYNKFNTIKENCCALCSRCNSEVNSNRIHWKKFFQSLLSEKYGYKYTENGEIIRELKMLDEYK